MHPLQKKLNIEVINRVGVKEKLDSEKTKEGIVALNRENVKVKMQEEKMPEEHTDDKELL
ncbi:MAG: hypothetical protein V8S42_09925 [Lachnospiraceae bacterium]